jgi:hypothetical protein
MLLDDRLPAGFALMAQTYHTAIAVDELRRLVSGGGIYRLQPSPRQAVRFGMAAGAAALPGSGSERCGRADTERLCARSAAARSA